MDDVDDAAVADTVAIFPDTDVEVSPLSWEFVSVCAAFGTPIAVGSIVPLTFVFGSDAGAAASASASVTDEDLDSAVGLDNISVDILMLDSVAGL